MSFAVKAAVLVAGSFFLYGMHSRFPDEVLGVGILLGAAIAGIVSAGGFGSSEAEPY